MKIEFFIVGKTTPDYLEKGVNEYVSRLQKYAHFTMVLIPSLKLSSNMSINEVKKRESAEILSKIEPSTFVVLLDDKGKSLNSLAFAEFIQQKMNASVKKLCFISGGAYGFSTELYDRADYKLSLSAMTFSHQLVRIIFTEQLYRAYTILKGEKYHHE
jgi:23S rRNA (pseudouridine1915-N3)-methyltransferase